MPWPGTGSGLVNGPRSNTAGARHGVITLDRTADGYGWFLDPTPGNDLAFATNALNSPARGHVDLLSVVAHELGHLLGYGEDESNGVTGEYLAPGVRHVPLAALPGPGTVSDRPLVINLASSSIGGSSLAKPQAAASPRLTRASDGLTALDPAPFGLRAPRTVATRPARAPQAAVAGLGLVDRSRPTAGASSSPALDPRLVDALLHAATLGSLLDLIAPSSRSRRRSGRPPHRRDGCARH